MSAELYNPHNLLDVIGDDNAKIKYESDGDVLVTWPDGSSATLYHRASGWSFRADMNEGAYQNGIDYVCGIRD